MLAFELGLDSGDTANQTMRIHSVYVADHCGLENREVRSKAPNHSIGRVRSVRPPWSEPLYLRSSRQAGRSVTVTSAP